MIHGFDLDLRSPIFWIGTEAELIKLLPVMKSLASRKVIFSVVATGQNPVYKSELFELLPVRPQIFILSSGPGVKSPLGLLFWFFRVFVHSLFKMPRASGGKAVLVIHGDTVSTLMGAMVGWVKRYKVAHVEAGLRSFNYFKPFPEEIDRVLSSFFVDIHYCPNENVARNIKGKSDEVIVTDYNTLIDSLELFRGAKPSQNFAPEGRYFVFVVHRQENLFDATFIQKIVAVVLEEAKVRKCVIVLHEPTRLRLASLGLLDLFTENPNVVCVERLPYFNFMQLLSSADFLVTDGGSNQEESSYLGLPCLVLRDFTERTEGLNSNVLLERHNWKLIEHFFKHYNEYRREPISPKIRPSDVIASHLQALT